MLDKLGVPVVDIYGDSYGTYFAQAFAVRHPGRVRAVVLDAAFGVEGFDPWIRQESIGLRYAWPELCRRTVGCDVDVLATLRRWAVRLQRRPLVGRGRDADGGRQRVRVDGAALGQMTGDGSFYYTIYRDLLAALRAYGRGDPEPLLRIAAEDLPYTGAAARSRATPRVPTPPWPVTTTRRCGTRPPRFPSAGPSTTPRAHSSSPTPTRPSPTTSG